MGKIENDLEAASTRIVRENERHLLEGRAPSETHEDEGNAVVPLIGKNRDTAERAPDRQSLACSCIPLQPLFQLYETIKSIDIYAMSADPDTDTLFLTYEANDGLTRSHMGVREISLRGSSSGARDAFNGGSITRVWGVQFVRATRTLLINTNGGDDGDNRLLALSRDGDKWRIAQRVPFQLGCLVHYAELTDGHVLYASIGSGPSVSRNLIQVLCVSREQENVRIGKLERVQFNEKFSRFDARVIAQDILVAVLLKDKSRVRLYRLQNYLHLEKLSEISLSNTMDVLWCGHRLLACRRNDSTNTNSVVELKRSSGKLELNPTLLEGMNVEVWCDTGDRIAIFDKNTTHIQVFCTPF